VALLDIGRGLAVRSIGRDGGVHSGATRLEHVHADLGGERAAAAHQAVLAQHLGVLHPAGAR
jgi:hypothetical protein